MHRSHLQYLICPTDCTPLYLHDDCEVEGEYIRNGMLVSAKGQTYPIINYIPRFTTDSYAANFSFEWSLHPTIQHESKSGYTLYRKRFAEATRWEDDLSGQIVLEAGCGNGPMTVYPLERGALVISVDLSTSVDEARKTIGSNPNSLFIQANIFSMPFRSGTFDKCFCFGVLQHTPNPERAFGELVAKTKPGGSIAADSYIIPDRKAGGGHIILRAKYRFRKLNLNKLSPNTLDRLIKVYIDILWPFYRFLESSAKHSSWSRRLMLDDYKARLPGIAESEYKKFANIDIMDFLSPVYDIPQSVGSFRSFFENAGLINIDVHPGYNGIEGRGQKPPDSRVDSAIEENGSDLDEVETIEPAGSTKVQEDLQSVAHVSTAVLAEELARRLGQMSDNPVHDTFYRHGFHLLRKHFYLPIPDDRDGLEEFWQTPSAMPGINTNDAVALELIERLLPPYFDEFRLRFPIEPPASGSGFYLLNGGYMAVDAHMYYALIRHFKPRRIVEIGNGNSTLVAAAACEANLTEHGHDTDFISIDPYPWEVFRSPYPGLTRLIPERVQDVPIELFDALAAQDILFIDSSHVIRSGNDVHYEYLEILPRLRPGVLVHVHDISLPKPYPKVYYDNQLYWNEQYLLQAFLIYNSLFEIIWPGNYMDLTYPEKIAAVFPELQLMRERYPSSEPTAFWMRTRLSPALVSEEAAEHRSDVAGGGNRKHAR